MHGLVGVSPKKQVLEIRWIRLRFMSKLPWNCMDYLGFHPLKQPPKDGEIRRTNGPKACQIPSSSFASPDLWSFEDLWSSWWALDPLDLHVQPCTWIIVDVPRGLFHCSWRSLGSSSRLVSFLPPFLPSFLQFHLPKPSPMGSQNHPSDPPEIVSRIDHIFVPFFDCSCSIFHIEKWRENTREMDTRALCLQKATFNKTS